MKLAKTLDIQPKDFTKDIYWRGETYQDDDSLLKLADLKKIYYQSNLCNSRPRPRA